MKRKRRQRARGTGCIYARKRKDGSIRGYWAKFYRNGEQIVRNLQTTDKEDAEAKLLILLGEKAKGVPIVRHQLTLQQAAENVEQVARNNGEGQRGNYVFEQYLLPYFGKNTKMSAITSPQIERYKEHRLNAGVMPATINRELEKLRRAFTVAMDQGLLFARPKITKLKEDNTREGFFEREQFTAFVPHLPEPLQHVVRFAYVTGWRRSEILDLKWKNVDLKNGVVRLDPDTTKNDDGRVFPVNPELRQVLERRQELARAPYKRRKVVKLKDDPEALVFTKKNGLPILSFDKAWRIACRAAGIHDRVIERELPNGKVVSKVRPGRIFHDFRRTAVRNLENAGVPRSQAMKLVGHRTEAIYNRYAIVNENDLRAAVVKLDAWAHRA